MATKAEYARRVMQRLGVLDPDENPTQQEQADIVSIMDSVHEYLKEKAVLVDAIPDMPARYEEPFVDLIAWHVSPNFGIQRRQAPAGFRPGERELYSLSTARYDPQSNPYTDF